MDLTAEDKRGTGWEQATHCGERESRKSLHTESLHLKHGNGGLEMYCYLLPASELDPAGCDWMMRGRV